MIWRIYLSFALWILGVVANLRDRIDVALPYCRYVCFCSVVSIYRLLDQKYCTLIGLLNNEIPGFQFTARVHLPHLSMHKSQHERIAKEGIV
jgi:hypothetical protein